MFEADKADKAAMSVDTKGAATAKVNIKSCDSDVATNAAPVNVKKRAACSNHATPIIHVPSAQGTTSARSTHVLPIIHITVGTGTDGGGGAAAAAPGTASAARTNEKSTKGDAKKRAKKHVPVIHWGGRSA
jgi:tRNA nucleotidyltransferase/poly(A) polymerase